MLEEIKLVSVRQEARLIVNVEDQCEESEKQNRPFKTLIESEASAESESSLSLSSDVSGPKRTLNYSGAAIKKRQAAIKYALVKLFEASTQTVETEMQYSELDEILKNEGHKFSSKSVIPCVKKTFPGVSYAWRSKTFKGLGRITPGATESQQQEEQEDEKIFENKVALLLHKNFELQQTVLTYFRGFTEEEEQSLESDKSTDSINFFLEQIHENQDKVMSDLVSL